ncbi:MAG: hypothetical protein ACJKTH_03135 [Patescibacteria group bacterium UBA2163]
MPDRETSLSDARNHIKNATSLSHAYLIRGDVTAGDMVQHALKERGIVFTGNPDCMMRHEEQFDIDAARSVMQFTQLRPVGENKYIVIHAQTITTGAQNALLKAVEEGIGNSVFFFIVPPGVGIVPTLASRCITLQGNDTYSSDIGETFLNLSYGERIAQAEAFGKKQDREGARALVRSLLVLAHTKQFDASRMRDLLNADQYLQLTGSSPKGVIGHLALVL